jgi:hypothetical protein
MPALFTLPKQIPLSSAGLLLPGAKLTFSQTGTSTPQNTYQDVLLTTPHANPVVADSAGVFAPIYLDPSLPNYRAKLTTSADVLVYQVDDVPSNQNEAQTFKLTSTAPQLVFNETDASANNKKWRIRAQGEQLLIELLNDAESVATAIATVTRSGTSSPVFNFGSGFLTVAGLTVPTFQFDFFTATFTGMTGATSGSVLATRYGPGLCFLTASAAINGTSNTTAMTFTGVPSAYRPVGNTTAFGLMVDNGVTKGGLCTVSSAGVVSFGIGVDGTTLFTNSGTKGIPAKWMIVYTNA